MRLSTCSLLTILTVFGLIMVMSTSGVSQDHSQVHIATPEKRKELYEAQRVLFERLNIAEAWRITKGNPDILVGVIDNGFDYFHPELRGQVIPGFSYSGAYHTEFYHNIAHGTLVASLIVAKENDQAGMSGLAPKCRVLTASQGMTEHALLKLQTQFLRDNPEASLADLQKEMSKHSDTLRKFGEEWVHFQIDGAAGAIRYLVDGGVRVINISGALKQSLCPSAEKWKKLEEAFTYAAEKGVVIVLSAGNEGAQSEDYPGSPENVIVAGATLLNDAPWEEEVVIQGAKVRRGSNFGKRLTVMAPVENLVVCAPHEPRFYACDDGPMGPVKLPFQGPYELRTNGATSAAAPIVSSLAALVYSVRPELDAKSIILIIQQGCDHSGQHGHDLHMGYGRVNFGKTLKLAIDWNK